MEVVKTYDVRLDAKNRITLRGVENFKDGTVSSAIDLSNFE